MKSKLPEGGTTIFTTMSALAREHNAINLSQGFPDYDGPPQLLKLVDQYLHDGKNQYAPMPGLPKLREAIAHKVNQSYGLQLGADNVTITAGATQALFTFIHSIVHPGDEVIIFEPAYDSYFPSIILAGGTPVPYAMDPPDYSIDWGKVRSLVTKKTRLIIINTPHNPTGSLISQDDMLELNNLIAGRDIYLLSDEVYEHLIFDGQHHQSILRFPELFDRGAGVYSFGKTFHTTGWKMGYIIAPGKLTEEFRKIHQWNVFCVNSFLQHALADYLCDEDHYNYLNDFYQKKRDFLLDQVNGSRFIPLPCRGTYFQVFDYSGISDMDDVAFAKWMTQEHGVASIPVSVFYSYPRKDRLIRICFAKEELTIRAGALRLKSI